MNIDIAGALFWDLIFRGPESEGASDLDSLKWFEDE